MIRVYELLVVIVVWNIINVFGDRYESSVGWLVWCGNCISAVGYDRTVKYQELLVMIVLWSISGSFRCVRCVEGVYQLLFLIVLWNISGSLRYQWCCVEGVYQLLVQWFVGPFDSWFEGVYQLLVTIVLWNISVSFWVVGWSVWMRWNVETILNCFCVCVMFLGCCVFVEFPRIVELFFVFVEWWIVINFHGILT